MPGALSGIRVMDLTQGDGGTYATMQLGDAGAEVIKVEPPAGDWARGLGPPFVGGESAFFLGLNRNKKSMTLNLKTEKGKEIALKLAKYCDVLVENMRPGTADRLGLGYETLKTINPKLVYCSVTALESEGPDKDLPATELTVQARTRVMGMQTGGRAPVRVGTDYVSVAAALYAVQAIVAALYYRNRTGKGQKVESSMLRAIVYHQGAIITQYTLPGDPGFAPLPAHFDWEWMREGYKTKDLPVLLIWLFQIVSYPASEKFREFCQKVGLGHIANDPRFATPYDRIAHAKEIKEYFNEAFKDKTSKEILELAESVGALNAPLNDYDTLFSHPQTLENGMVAEFHHPTAGTMKTLGPACKLSDTPAEIRLPPPLLGANTDEVLGRLGYTSKDIQGLRKAKVV